MDILDELRRLPDTVPALSAGTRAGARERMMSAIADASAGASAAARPRADAPRRARRGIWLAGVAAAATAAVVAGFALNATFGPKPPTALAEVLNAAAKLSVTASDPDLAPGQYLKITRDSASMVPWGPLGINGGLADSTAVWLQHSTDDVYVPADRSDDWVHVTDAEPLSTTDEHGVDVPAAMKAFADLMGPGRNPGPHATYLPGGREPGAAGDPRVYDFGGHVDPAAMPRDPAKLLAWYRQSWPSDANVFREIKEELEWNLLPADLRAAQFKALALLPRLELVSRDGDFATVGMDSKHEGYQRMTIDTKTGLVAEVQDFDSRAQLTEQVGAAPAGMPSDTERFTTQVVDGLPEGLGR